MNIVKAIKLSKEIKKTSSRDESKVVMLSYGVAAKEADRLSKVFYPKQHTIKTSFSDYATSLLGKE